MRIGFLSCVVFLLFSAQLHADDAAYSTITAADLARHIQTLSSDEYLGRAPGTEGETKTVRYLERAFEGVGAEEGFKGAYAQLVPLIEVSRTGPFQFSVNTSDTSRAFAPFDDFVAFDGDADGVAAIKNAKLVFAGYGITAPEYGWDDYQNAEVEGAIVIVMRGEPSRADDEDFFLGEHLTPHYHQDKKYALAAKHGARGVILIHTQENAGWPWTLMQSGGAGKTQSFLADADNSKLPDITIQMSEPATKQLFEYAGEEYERLTLLANERSGQLRYFDASADIVFTGEARPYVSSNIIAKIPGAEAPDECVIYTAHWDHVGVNPDLEGDTIFNGAVDNATGTAAMIEIAEAFASLDQSPRRSVFIVATTAEEKGLLGAKHLAQNPVCAPEKTVAVLNMDSHFPFGSLDAMTIIGYGYSEVQYEFERAAARIGRVLQPDSNPGVGAFYRNDAHPFAAVGIPAVYAVGAPKLDEMTEDDPLVKRYADFVTNKYHKPADEFDEETWDLTGIEEDARVFFDVGLSLANSGKFPNWRYDLPFRDIRDRMRAE